MPKIRRAGETPPYLSLAIDYVVATPVIPPAVSGLKLQQIQVPSFQRLIVWREENIDLLLDSKSAMFGTVIFANFPDEPWVLVDGLQRFATATSLLNRLYPEVLSPTASNRSAAVYFTRLATMAASFQAVFDHNADALRNHSRQALRESFALLESDISNLVTTELTLHPSEFATRVERMFLDKQVAIDPYFNFERKVELTNTFINMNSQGIDLSPVDLLRAKLVDQGMARNWNAADIELMENDFTDVFEDPLSKSTLKALGTLLNEAVDESQPRANVFPDWNHLTKTQVDELVTFISASILCARTGGLPSSSRYLGEIAECGGFPFAITLLYYLRSHMQDFSNGNYTRTHVPDFAGGSVNTTSDCHLLLRAYYRRLIDGTIARTGPIGVDILQGRYSSVSDVANKINPDDAGPLSGQPNTEWLKQRLRVADKERAARIFNACLLPPRNQAGSNFNPISYGRRQGQWNMDHLIPKISILRARPGEHEANRLPNFAPLPSGVNRSIRNNPCSTKLGPLGPYAPIVASHPYIQWLVQTHFSTHTGGTVLDDQACLVANSTSHVGDQRIDHLATLLSVTL